MQLKVLPFALSVCKLPSTAVLDLSLPFYFVGKTDEELSLVCKTTDVPVQAAEREDGWRCFRIEGVLDFSLVGILSRISGILAENGVAVFAVSTFNTDYLLVKEESFAHSLMLLQKQGYSIVGGESA